MRVALFAVCFGLLAWPSSLQAQGHADATVISVNQEGPERIVIDYDIDSFRQTPVNIDGCEYTQLKLGKESVMKEVVGAPELPQVCRSVIIPNDARMAVNVIASKHYDIPDILVTPSKGYISRKNNPADVPYTFGDAYKIDAFYPGEVASLGKPYILRDFRGVVLTLCPFQYNPVTETLRVYTNVTVEVVETQAGGVNVKSRPFRPDDVSLAYHKIYKNHFLNYRAESRYTPLGETGDMLIICHDAWLPNIQPLVDHKNNSMGISTTVVGVATIGNDSASIKNYIQNEYDTGNLAFVLLVGDADEVATPTASGGSSDPSYSKLAGSDNYPDIMVGRFSAQDSGDVDTQVERTIEYETMPATQQDWFKKGTGIGSTEGPGHNGEYDYQHIRHIRTDLLGYGYTEVDELYDGSQGGQDASGNPTASTVAACLNAGRGVINYCGHGDITEWVTSGFSNSNINALTNDNMLPFIFDVACVNGQFDGYTCFAETWLRATHGSEPTGAIGIYASSINQDWDPPMTAQDESVDLLVGESYFSLGALCYAGSCKMMDLHSTSGANMFNTWHVFGDPSVRVYGSTAAPTCDDGIQNQGEDRIDCGGPCYLTLGPIDLTDVTDVILRFRRWLNSDSQPFVYATLAVSNNGSNWTTLWSNGEYEITENSWSAQEYNISATADDQPAVYVRWGYEVDDPWAFAYSGWNIDDVEIWAVGGVEPTCSDGILNQGEDKIDCGGPCPACECLADGECADGLFCTGTETCDAYGHCQPGSYACRSVSQSWSMSPNGRSSASTAVPAGVLLQTSNASSTPSPSTSPARTDAAPATRAKPATKANTAIILRDHISYPPVKSIANRTIM